MRPVLKIKKTMPRELESSFANPTRKACRLESFVKSPTSKARLLESLKSLIGNPTSKARLVESFIENPTSKARLLELFIWSARNAHEQPNEHELHESYSCSSDVCKIGQSDHPLSDVFFIDRDGRHGTRPKLRTGFLEVASQRHHLHDWTP